MLAIYAGLASFTVITGSMVVLTYWLIPTVIGVPVARMLRVADHTGCVEESDLRNYARTVTTDRLTRFFCWNMSYHCEHHLAPSVPFHNLRKLHEEVGDELNPVDKGYIAVQWEVITKHMNGFWRKKPSSSNSQESADSLAAE